MRSTASIHSWSARWPTNGSTRVMRRPAAGGPRWTHTAGPRRSVGALRLPAGNRAGRLTVDPGPAVAVAAEVLSEAPDVRSARGSVLRDRGELVVRLRTTVDPAADLPAVVAACDNVLGELARVLPSERLRSRVEISVLREPAAAPRVQ